MGSGGALRRGLLCGPLWLLCALSGRAQAASIQLPAGEDPARWSLALQMGDFSVPGDVLIVDRGAQWEIQVRDGAGVVRTATVDEPQTAQAREDVALLASSLLRPLGPGAGWGLPVLPVIAPDPPEPRPRPLPPPPDLEALLAAQEFAPQPVAPPDPGLPLPIRAGRLGGEPSRVEVFREDRPWLVLDQRAIWQPGFRPTAGLGGSVGWRPVAPLLVGIGVEGQPSSALTVDPEARMGQIGVMGQVWWAADPLRLGLEGGCAWRTFSWRGQALGTWPVAQIGGMAAAYLELWPGVVARPWLGARLDLTPGRLTQGELDVGIVPVGLTAGLALHLPLRAQR